MRRNGAYTQLRRGLLSSQRIADINAQSWHLSQSDPAEALRLADSALEAARDVADPAAIAASQLNAGWALINLGHYRGAVSRLNEARREFASVGDTDGLLKTVNALGVIAMRVGEFEEAREFFLEEHETAAREMNTDRLVASLNNLGELCAQISEREAAHEYFRAALDAAKGGADRAAQAVIQVNLGRTSLEQGNPTSAAEELVQARELARGVEDRITEADALTNLGNAVAAAGEPDALERAEALHLESMAISVGVHNPSGEISALCNLGRLLVTNDRLADAERYLRRAAELARQTDAPITAFDALRTLIDRYQGDGELEHALALSRWLLELRHDQAQERNDRDTRSIRAAYEIEQTRMEAEIVRLRNVELRQKTDELERLNAKLQLMHRIGSELNGTLELEEIARRLHDRINELMSADVFGIAFYREDEDVLDFAHMIEDNQRLTPLSIAVDSEESFGSWVVRNRKEICLNDAERDYGRYLVRPKPFTAKMCRSIVYLPLEVEGRIIGVLTVQSSRKNRYRDEEMDLLRLLAPYIAVAIDNSRKHQQISTLNSELEGEKRQLQSAYARIAHMANHDILTQLPNRRLLVELLHEYIPLARRQARSFGLLYVDLDDFKPINDTFGHDAGDQVLIRIAERLRDAIRQSDTVSRIGGDEFVLVIRDVSGQSDVEAVAAKVLAAVMRPLTVRDQICRLTASIGLSMFPTHGENYDELLTAADRAMYAAKQQHKSGVAIAEPGGYRERTSSSEESIESPSKRKRPST